MDDLIKQLTAQLGIDSNQATQAAGSVMSLLKSEAGDDLFGKVASAIPGALAAAESAKTPTSAGGGAGLVGTVMGMLGGSAGKGFALAAALKALGIDESKLGSFGQIVVNFIQQKAGNDVVQQLLAKLPALQGLIGGEKA